MDISFHTGYSGGWVLLCLLVSIGVSYVFYRKRNFQPPWTKWGLFALRALGFFILLLLLLDPVFVYKAVKEDKPFLVFAVDRSKSIDQWSQQHSKEITEKINEAKKTIGSKYRIQVFYFGGGISFKDDSTVMPWQSDIGNALEYAKETYAQRGRGQLVLCTDGIVNQGKNPSFIEGQNNVKVHVVGLGDTIKRTDYKAVALFTNEIVPAGAEFLIEADVIAEMAKGKNAQIALKLDGVTVKNETWNLASDKAYKRIGAILKAPTKGFHKISVEIGGSGGEYQSRNNTLERWIEVVESNTKIALVYAYPHPDIGAIKLSLEQDQSKEVVTISAENAIKEDLSPYDAVILHQLPGSVAHAALFAQLKRLNKGYWLILGTGTQWSALTKANVGVEVDQRSKGVDIKGVYQPGFSAFQLDELKMRRIGAMPPLKGPYGELKVPGDFQTILGQQIGTVETGQPLWGIGHVDRQRMAVTFGEGIWKWRTKEYALYEDQEMTDELINKSVQFVVSREKNKRLKVYPQRREVGPEGRLVLLGEYFNINGEQENAKEVSVVLNKPNGNKSEFKLGKSGRGYRIDLGNLPSGEYKYRAQIVGEPNIGDEGIFLVKSESAELTELRTDIDLLKRVAKKGNGNYYPWNEWEQLIKELAKEEGAKPLLYSEKEHLHLLQWIWTYALLLVLFGGEWFLRKWLTGNP